MGTIRQTLGALAAGVILAAPAAATTLADTLVAAYENSGLLEQNRALLRAADEDVAIATAALAPILTWSAGATISNPRAQDPSSPRQTDLIVTNLQLAAELLVYDFGATDLAIEAQKENVLATRQELVSIEQDVLLRAAEAHLAIRRAFAFIQLRENNVRLITQELRAAEDRFEVGEVTRTDVSLAEARLASARSALASAQGDLAQAVEEYRAAVGTAPGNIVEVAPAPLDLGMEAAKAFAIRNHPSVLAARHNVTAAEIGIRRAEAALKPTVNLSGRVAFDDDFESSQSVTLGVSGPISQGGRLAATIRQAMAQRDASRSGLYITHLQVEQRVGNAYALLAVARASLDASVREVRAATVGFDGVREEARLGARTTLEVLDAEQDLLDARANRISSQIDEALASYRVLASMGLLTAASLNLGVQVYDPAAYYTLVQDAPLGQSDRGRALDRVLRAIGD